jgi:hypothetical protein
MWREAIAPGRGFRQQCVPMEGQGMRDIPDVAGMAALAICESLLLALNDRNVLPEREILGILRDAAEAHSGVDENDEKRDMNVAVAALINKILVGGNSVRRK